MYTLPTLFVFFLTGVLADNINRQKITIFSDLINAGFCILLILAAFSMNVLFIFPFLFLITAVSKFFTPAQTGLIQGILSHEEYAIAGGFNQMLTSIFLLFGTALGAFFYWRLGISGAILINGCSFLISASLIFHCCFPNEAVLPKGCSNPFHFNVELVFAEFKEGIFYILQHHVLRYLMLGTFILGFVNGGLSIMPIYMLKYKLATGYYQQAAALSGIVFGIGILLGSFAGL